MPNVDATSKKKFTKLLNISDIDERSVTSTLKLLDTKIDKYFHLNRQFELIEALKEIDAGESERLADILIPQYKEILENESEIRATLSQKPRYLERLQSKFSYFDLYRRSSYFFFYSPTRV